MISKIGSILSLLVIPTMSFAELTKAECAQIESAIGKTPIECQSSAPLALAPPLGAPVGVTWQNHVFFPSGGSTLDTNATAKLQSLSEILKGDVMAGACIQLIGHSDSSGGATANQRLGQLRADKVAEYLGALLNDATRIDEHVSYGESRPLPGRASTDRWQRRVEIRARNCGAKHSAAQTSNF